MSNRSLIEINHDFAGELGDEFLLALRYYLSSGSREDAAELRRHGVHVISMRHHSGRYYVEPTTDGFPVESPLSRRRP
jgi:hypothetical protein